MQNPFALDPNQSTVTMGHIFDAPVVGQGWNWLPANQVILWLVFGWQSFRQRPHWPAGQHVLLGGLKMAVVLGSEWCHNLAHTAAARAVGKPVDAVRIVAGMPLLLYNEPEHPSITPRQHILRSMAGPLCNLVLLAASLLARCATRSGSPAREVADAAAGINVFIGGAGLAPVPVFDGGPLLKWSMIERGASEQQAAHTARRANRLLGPGLLGAAAALAASRKWLPAAGLALVGSVCCLFGWKNLE